MVATVDGEAVAKRGRGRPRALPVRTTPIGDLEAYERLRAGRALNSFQAIKVMAFCSVWQRTGGTITGAIESGNYQKRTAQSRLARCRAAGFEPELVRWDTRTGAEWEEFADLEYRHANEEYVKRLEEYEGRPAVSRALRRRPRRHPSLDEP